ncbi:MAG: HEAT repeat domain-containing protein [Planctomycetota bacterium]
MRRLISSGICLLLLTSCGPSESPRVEGKDLFKPIPLFDPPARRKLSYAFSSSESIERVVRKLDGATTKRAWDFSKGLLGRSTDPEVLAAVIDYLKKHLLSTGDTAPAVNALEVMQRSGNSVYAGAVLEATAHLRETVRIDALRALATCADEDAARQVAGTFSPLWDSRPRTQSLIIRVVAKRHAPEKAARFLRRVLAGDLGANRSFLRTQVLQALSEGAPPETIRATLEGGLAGLKPLEAVMAAKLLHESGSEEGRLLLLDRLAKAKDVKLKLLCIKALAGRDPDRSRAEVERFVVDGDPRLRAAVATYLGTIPGKGTTRSLEVLARDSETIVRRAAFAMLKGRGPCPVLERVIEDLKTVTGTRLREALIEVQLAGDSRAVAVIDARLRNSAGAERRAFLQALGSLEGAASVEALCREFLRPPLVISENLEIDSASYAALMLSNHPEAHDRLWELYDSLKNDPVRTSHVLMALNNIAKAPHAPNALTRRIVGRFRSILYDGSAPARDRTQVLGYLTRELGFEDCANLKRMLRRQKQTDPGFRTLVNDYLWELF